MLVPVAIGGGGGGGGSLLSSMMADATAAATAAAAAAAASNAANRSAAPWQRHSSLLAAASAAAFLARSFSQASCTRLTRCAPPRALTLVPCPSLVSQRLKIDPKEHKIMLTEAAMNPKKNREKLVETMFETFGFNGVHCSIQVGRARKRDAAIGLHLAMVRRRLRRNPAVSCSCIRHVYIERIHAHQL